MSVKLLILGTGGLLASVRGCSETTVMGAFNHISSRSGGRGSPRSPRAGCTSPGRRVPPTRCDASCSCCGQTLPLPSAALEAGDRAKPCDSWPLLRGVNSWQDPPPAGRSQRSPGQAQGAPQGSHPGASRLQIPDTSARGPSAAPAGSGCRAESRPRRQRSQVQGMAAPEPEPSRAALLGFLREHGGQVRSAELRDRFKPLLEAGEPGERAARRERFKALVNSVAVVKELDGAKFVVLRKKLRAQAAGEPGAGAQPPEAPPKGAGQSGAGGQGPPPAPPAAEDCESRSPKPVSELRGLFQSQDGETPEPPPGMPGLPRREAPQKPCMLPVRCPQPARGIEELPRQQEQLEDRARLQVGTLLDVPEPASPRSPHMKRRQVDEAGARSPHLRRVSKTQKVSEETGCTAAVPLESLEHEWLVKATAGQWSQRLHGLLLSDASLAGKRDFMSGFTALHWAAKSGNCDMVGKIIEVAKKGGTEIDVNAKSYGGYTPLHIAAIHGREDVITTLVKTYNVKVNLRDYSGKKPHHYLKEGSSYAVRHLLGDPDLHNSVGHAFPIKKNPKIAASILSSTSTFLGVLSDDMPFYDLSRGLKKTSSLNKLLNASAGSRKKPKTRGTFPSYSSLVEAVEEEQEEEATVKHRPVSELFFSH
ncbi:ankyrin repeat domain-containing protein SOWAHA [Malaclemys terrapin pileata]|uniref:ankyrin repeat domain-containing protein SOWAHA n=1 Tax=Malaclemys terrapin pileata TaxID=2991368 RepID=UPI0023A8923A|nr:ankyrin repeat domain-containing protein SOWAHA [Malaclemys terrapin pileata]